MLKQGAVGIETRKEQIAASPDKKPQLRLGGFMLVKTIGEIGHRVNV